jgi:hypothetical protein
LNGDQIGATVFLALVIYTWGCVNRGWTSPADVIRQFRHDRQNGWSDDPTPDTDMSDDDVVSDVGSGVGSLDRQIPARAMTGPRPIEDLRAEQPDDDDPPPVSRGERREWVALRMRPDDALRLSPIEIDRKGAKLFGCSEKTIERDRQILAGRVAGGGRQS